MWRANCSNRWPAWNMLHVPYRGDAPALADLMAGQMQVYFSGAAAIPYVKSGTLRALAVANATRSEALPDVPTLDVFVPGYEASTWFGVVAPKNTPAEIVNLLNKEVNAGLPIPR